MHDSLLVLQRMWLKKYARVGQQLMPQMLTLQLAHLIMSQVSAYAKDALARQAAQLLAECMPARLHQSEWVGGLWEKVWQEGHLIMMGLWLDPTSLGACPLVTTSTQLEEHEAPQLTTLVGWLKLLKSSVLLLLCLLLL